MFMSKKVSELFKVTKNNDYDKVQKILYKLDKEKGKEKLKQAFDINQVDPRGFGLIHYAAQSCNIDLIHLFYKYGANIDLLDANGRRPISYACVYQGTELLKSLLIMNSSPNILNPLRELNGPIHLAAANGYIEHVKLLLQKGADIQAINGENQTALDVAFRNKMEEMGHFLLREVTESMVNSRHNPESRASFESLQNLSGSFESPKRNYSTQYSKKFSEYNMNSPTKLHYSQTLGRKSNSLNTVCVSTEEPWYSKKRSPSGEVTNNQEENEIVLPYPTFYGGSEQLKVKSPMMPSKKIKIHSQTLGGGDQISRNLIKTRQVNFKMQNGSNDLINVCNPNYEELEQLPGQHQPIIMRRDKRNTKPDLITFMPHERGSGTLSPKQQLSWSPSRAFFGSKLKSNTISNDTFRERTNSSPINKHQSSDKKFNFKKWIMSLNLQSILPVLENSGYDSFIALSLINEDELLRLCNYNIQLWNIIVDGIKRLNIPPISWLTLSDEIQILLKQLGLQQYKDNFDYNGFDYVSNMSHIFSEVDLDKLEILKPGHRKLILSIFSHIQNSQKAVNYQPRVQMRLKQEANKPPKGSFPIMRPHSSSSMSEGKCRASPPPPIPPRSCSLIENNLEPQSPTPRLQQLPEGQQNITLDDILSDKSAEVSPNPQISPIKIKESLHTNIESLDDVLNMLSNLQK